MKIPFGIAQTGKAFRNEIVARQFIFRMREFEQMEMQFFVRPGTQMEWYNYWKDARKKWHESIGIPADKLRYHDHIKLAHYADAALDIEFEFTPTPAQTNQIVEDSYQIRRNLLIRFKKDNLDQSANLRIILQELFPDMVTTKTLSGNHTTPLGQDVKWQPGSSFSPFDALGQWLKQEVYRDLNQLKQVILFWLNPLSY
jgi:hypothetical protein